MNSQRVNVVFVLFDHLLEDPVFGSEDHRSLGSSVELDGSELIVVDLLEGTEVHVGRAETVHLTCFEDDSGSWCAGGARGFSEERVELVDGEKVTEPVDSELSAERGGGGQEERERRRGE